MSNSSALFCDFNMALFDGRLLPRWMRNAVKRFAAAPGATRHSELFARFHWQARLAQMRRESNPPVFPSREQLYAHVNEVFFESGRTCMDFLEFGVFEGASLRSWSSLNQNPETRLWGFDSFEGLPEDWHAGKGKGTFSTQGKVPELGDPRVQYVVGWFQQTLPQFLASFKPRDRLIIHNDSDLYSSTLYCLTMMDASVRPGTILIFDDFYDSMHQFRALMDYAAAYLRRFRLIATTRSAGQAALEVTK